MGSVLRRRLVRGGLTDRSSSEFASALKRDVRVTFKDNTPEDIASYYLKAGHAPPPGLEHLTQVGLTPEERSWGNVAYVKCWFGRIMKQVYEEGKLDKYDMRKNEARRRMRCQFNELPVASQRMWALRRKLHENPMKVDAKAVRRGGDKEVDAEEADAQEGSDCDSSIEEDSKEWRELPVRSREREQRAKALREALASAAGGGVDPDDLAEALHSVLNSEERSTVSERFAACSGTDKVWVILGKALVAHLLESASRKFQFSMLVICLALRDAGYKCRKKIRDHLGLYVWKSQWKASNFTTKATIRSGPCNNGRTGARKWEQTKMRDFLMDHSVATSAFVMPPKRKLSLAEGVDAEPQIKRALTDSAYQLWHQVGSGLSSATFYRNLANDHYMIKKSCRKLDACEKCVQFDNQVSPAVKKSMALFRQQMFDIDSSYWKRWDAEIAPMFQALSGTTGKFAVSAKCAQTILDYMQSQQKGRKNDLDLWNAEKAIRKEILVEWSALREEETEKEKEAEKKEAEKAAKDKKKKTKKQAPVQAGMLEVLQAYELHFTYKTECKTLYNQEFDEPPEDTLCMHADFGEHDSLPVGPKETSGFFYAGAVLGVTILVIIVWSKRLGKRYYTFCTDVKEQSSLFTISCVEHVLTLLDVSSYKHFHWWSDIGPHFLSTRWLGYWLVHLVRSYKVICRIRFFPAGHGKGPCDAHVGRVKKWKRTAAKKTIIATVEKYVEVMKSMAKKQEHQVPEGSVYIFVPWEPPPKDSLPDVVLSTIELNDLGMGVRSTHFWSGQWKGWAVEISKHPLPNAPPSKVLMSPKFVTNDDEDDAGGGCAGEWKRYYRINKPEQIKLNPRSLLRTWRVEKTSLVQQKIQMKPRRQSVDLRRLAFLRGRLNQKATAAKRRGAERKLRSTSLESSSSSTSSSEDAEDSGSSGGSTCSGEHVF